MAQAKLVEGLEFWGRSILSDSEAKEWKSKLGAAKQFLESLQAFNTAGKLNNFPHDVEAVQGQKDGLELIKSVDELVELVAHVGPETAYLTTAEAILPTDHSWLGEVAKAKSDLLTKVMSPSHRADSGFQRKLAQTLSELKTRYQDAYLELHKRAHLDAKGDKQKAALTNDPRLKQLQKLDAIEIMPHQQLKAIQDKILGLPTCFALTRKELERSPICTHTQYRPVENPPGPGTALDVLRSQDDRLDEIVSDWTQTLLGNLDEDPTVAENIGLISDPKGKKELKAFMADRVLPDTISPALVKALQEALTGLERVTVAASDLRDALVKGGIPCTVEELKERFERYVAATTKGKSANKIRVVVE